MRCNKKCNKINIMEKMKGSSKELPLPKKLRLIKVRKYHHNKQNLKKLKRNLKMRMCLWIN